MSTPFFVMENVQCRYCGSVPHIESVDLKLMLAVVEHFVSEKCKFSGQRFSVELRTVQGTQLPSREEPTPQYSIRRQDITWA